MRAGFVREMLAIRIAAGEIRRNVARNVLIASLVLVPVACTTALLTAAESMVPTPDEIVEIYLGARAEGLIRVVSAPDISLTQDALNPNDWNQDHDAGGTAGGERLAPEDVLPDGTRILTISESFDGLVVDTASGRGRMFYVEGEVWDSSLDGSSTLSSGRAPNASGEVLVSPSALQRLGLSIGDSIEVYEPEEMRVTIVGTLEDSKRPASADVLYAPQATIPAAMEQLHDQFFVVPDLALAWSNVRDLNSNGMVAWSRQVISDPPPRSGGYEYDVRSNYFGLAAGVGSFSMFSIVILAGAAFSVGASNRRRSLALISSIGASRAAIIRIVSADGIVIGILGSVTGVAVGIPAGWIWRTVADNGDRTALPGLHLNVLLTLAVAVVAVLVCFAASLGPAIVASRIDALDALRGSLKPRKPSRRAAVSGFILIAAGTISMTCCALSVFILYAGAREPDPSQSLSLITAGVGAILLVVGIVILAPASFKKLAGLLGGSALPLRLAVRDLSANSHRSIPMFAAITAMVALTSFAVSNAAHQQQRIEDTAVVETTPGRVAIQLVGSGATDMNPSTTATITRAAMRAVSDVLGDSDVRLLQRPSQDWNSFYAGGAQSYIRAIPDPTKMCSPETNTALNSEPGVANSCEQANLVAQATAIGGYGPGVASIVIAEPDDIEFILETTLSAEENDLLERGGALALWPELVTDDEVTIGWQAFDAAGVLQTTTAVNLPARVIDGPRLLHQVFITPETAEVEELLPVEAFILADPTSPPTESQLDQIWAELNSLVPGIAQVRVTYDSSSESRQTTGWVVAIASSVTLAAGSLAIAIGWIEAAATRSTFRSLGAGSRLLRTSQALSIAMLGLGASGAGLACGLLPAVALFSGTEIGFSVPLLLAPTMLVGLPVVFAGVAFALPTEQDLR